MNLVQMFSYVIILSQSIYKYMYIVHLFCLSEFLDYVERNTVMISDSLAALGSILYQNSLRLVTK